MMRYLIISVLLFSSCVTTTKGFVEQSSKVTVITNNYFSDIEKDYVYKAKINIKDNNFGGLLIIKKVDEQKHRVVFTTEFGNKIFDFEFDNTNFKVNYIIDKLDRKIIINALKKDYQLLIKQTNTVEKQYLTNNFTVYKTKLNKKNNYYYYKNKRLSKIIMATKYKEKLSIYFNEVEGGLAKKITMKHHNIKMIILLNFIGE